MAGDPFGVVEAAADEIPGTLVPDVSASLPDALVAGSKTRPIAVTVTITNVAEVAFSGPATVTLFATADELFQAESDPQLALSTKRLTLESGQSKAVKLKVKGFPAVPDGDYRVLARVTAPGVDPAGNASFNTVNIAAPFVDLAGTFGTLPATLARGKRARLSLTLTNAANSAIKATVPVTITVSPPPGTAGAPVSLGTINAKVSLKAGQTKAVRLSVLVPADLAAGTYFLDAVLDPANVLAEGNETNNTITGTTPVTVA
jgi:uncharacterized membrane protein